MTVFDLLGESIVVAYEELGLIIGWNHSVTFNVWRVTENSLEAIDCFTRHGHEDMSVYEARAIAQEWLHDNEVEESDEGEAANPTAG